MLFFLKTSGVEVNTGEIREEVDYVEEAIFTKGGRLTLIEIMLPSL